MKRWLPILAVLLLAVPCFSAEITVPLTDLTDAYTDGQIRTATFDLGAGTGPVIAASLQLQGGIDIGLYRLVPDDGYVYFINARWFFRYVDHGSLVFYSSDWDGPTEETLSVTPPQTTGPNTVEIQLVGDALVGMGDILVDRWPTGHLDSVALVLTVDDSVGDDDSTWGGMKVLFR